MLASEFLRYAAEQVFNEAAIDASLAPPGAMAFLALTVYGEHDGGSWDIRSERSMRMLLAAAIAESEGC
jgi:hypothetical protein